MNKLNPSIKLHLLIGLFLAVWVFLFAFFIRPFEHGTMDLMVWIKVSIGFSVLAFFCYAAISYGQKIIYEKNATWNVSYEILTLISFYILYTIATYIFYISPIINGIYNLLKFTTEIILVASLIMTPILILVRTYTVKLIPPKQDIITIKGDNKLDVLKIYQSDLICISNAQNYVEIFYLDNNELNSKLIRSSLKKLQENFDFLLQVHRSHLINPVHFKSWKDGATISLTQMELPVSKSYKDQVLAL